MVSKLMFHDLNVFYSTPLMSQTQGAGVRLAMLTWHWYHENNFLAGVKEV